MTKLVTGKLDDTHERHVFPCDSGDGYLIIEWDIVDDDDHPDWRMLWVEHHSASNRWRDRVAMAWKVLTKGDVPGDGVLLNKTVTEDLHVFLSTHIGPRTMPLAQVQALVDLCFPDDMTPGAKHAFESAIAGHEGS